ncbi:MAG TPA: NAD-binding protein [Gammaproteobacteria bacterium]|nr:NAD-binding protein [Gammaproteobacteria bacterium]
MLHSTDSHRVTFIVLRYMRRPILVLVSVYAISMVGWVMIPGVNVDGKPEPLSFFHAFYFLTYTATTTGFGEIPYSFSDAQRMWSIISLYAGVVAWLYAVGSIIRLLQNPHFRYALAERRFAKFVARIHEPFVILCGFGNTGSLLARGLSDAGMTAVIIDKDIDRINALQLRDYRVAMPGICANARVPAVLTDAGLLSPNCKAIVALTSDEEVNLKIAVSARLLNPSVQVITQSTSVLHEEAIATLGSDVHIVDPFQTYGRYLGATIDNPAIYVLNRWLVGDKGADLDAVPRLPRGKWILCGYGRMGRRIHEALENLRIETAIIDPEIGESDDIPPNFVRSRASQTALREAGIAQATGIVAGTDDDAYNLSILLNARTLNPKIFMIVRQELHMNERLFSVAGAQLIMQPNLVSARRVLFELIAPLLKPFFERVRASRIDGDDGFLRHVFDELRENVGSDTVPRLWTVNIDKRSAPAILQVIENEGSVSLRDVFRDPAERERRLACVALVVRSGKEIRVMPDQFYRIRSGDEILLCGGDKDLHLLEATLHNEYTLKYLISGDDEPRGYVMQWIMRRLNGGQPRAV